MTIDLAPPAMAGFFIANAVTQLREHRVQTLGTM